MSALARGMGADDMRELAARGGSFVATVARPPGGFQLQSKKGKWTARIPKLSFLHIKILDLYLANN
jgi:hypothetical protein